MRACNSVVRHTLGTLKIPGSIPSRPVYKVLRWKVTEKTVAWQDPRELLPVWIDNTDQSETIVRFSKRQLPKTLPANKQKRPSVAHRFMSRSSWSHGRQSETHYLSIPKCQIYKCLRSSSTLCALGQCEAEPSLPLNPLGKGTRRSIWGKQMPSDVLHD